MAASTWEYRGVRHLILMPGLLVRLRRDLANVPEGDYTVVVSGRSGVPGNGSDHSGGAFCSTRCYSQHN